MGEKATKGTIVLAGSLAQRPGVGGHTWVFLQYLLGFRQLGWHVLFLDALGPDMCADAAGDRCPVERSENLRYLAHVMERFGLGDDFSLLYKDSEGRRFIGLPRGDVLERVRGSALLINVMGFLTDEELLTAAPRRVFLDIDPGFGQMWRELGYADVFAGHTDFVTIGQNVGRPDCGVPTLGLDWVTTPQPVVLEQWPVRESGDGRGAFTSVVSWRGPFGPIEYRGRTYGLRVHEFRKFIDLPRRAGGQFELALDIHANEVNDIALLDANGWERVDPRRVAGDPWAYRDYVASSAAEFMIAKNLYVQTGGGWVSDRSICYLASGRPVLAQDTGIGHFYPTGEGLLTFSNLEEAETGARSIRGDYARHCKAARRLAEDYFDSSKVLVRLLEKLGVG
ncbi:MAG: hypothetical protein JWN51_2990 [Phycisphaerales bacterium]|nr:hypothetical protein [Phycisphaerales bacterium]